MIFTEYQLSLEKGLEVNLIGHSVCNRGWSICNRHLPDMEFIVVYSGQLLCEIDHIPYLLKEGDGCLIPPGVLISQYSHNGPCRFFYTHIETGFDVIEEDKRNELISKYINAQEENQEQFFILPPREEKDNWLFLGSHMDMIEYKDEIFTLFEKALLERNQQAPGYLYMLSLYVQQILSLASRCFLKKAQTQAKQVEREQKKLVQDTLSYINAHYAEGINIRLLSADFFVSQQYLTRVFKAAMGISPIKYMNKIRIEQAKKLIRTTNENLSSIAFEVGFDNIYYFSRTFKQYEGISPLHYRNWLNSKSNQ
ncbi:AraC family transcriptional regulator [Anaerocolumna jejuensis]|uniref:AraC family transcriptional regulator n=1 Tax=Anaerocolumna jejuensis TaxID=259063 RepID=UPI000933C52E|nr:helix-turn-helix domain-containing protein [Anaerocolumna jejuensis]